MPNIIDKFLHLDNGDGFAPVTRRYVGRFGMAPKIIVLHVQQGNNWGSYQHFHSVLASATVMIAKNGDIWRLVPESDAPWTNGDVNAPTALGWEVINRWGADPNVYSLTIEFEGFTDDMPLTGPQIESGIWQVATWQKQYGIPDHLVIRHADINQVDRPYCPNPTFFNEVKRRLGAAVVDTNPVYVAPMKVLVDGKPWDGTKDVTINTALFHGQVETVSVSVDGLKVRQYASANSSETHEPMAAKSTLNVLGWVQGEAVDGENRWWITKNYSRVWVGGTTEKPTKVTKVEKPDVLPDGVKIVNGKVHYPTIDETGHSKKVTTVGKANLRSEPTLNSKAVGEVENNTQLYVRYWCFGDEVHGENIWWLVSDGGDPFKEPKYLWIASTMQRPR